MDPTPWTQGIPIPNISSSTALGQCYFKFMDGIGIQILRVILCPLTSRNCIGGGENPASGGWWDPERKIKGYLGLCHVGLKCKKQLFKEIETLGRFLKWLFKTATPGCFCVTTNPLGPLLESLPGEHPKSSGIGGTLHFSCPKTHPRAIGPLEEIFPIFGGVCYRNSPQWDNPGGSFLAVFLILLEFWGAPSSTLLPKPLIFESFGFQAGQQRWWEQEITVNGNIQKGELITYNLTELIKPEAYEVRLTPITRFGEGDSTIRVIKYSGKDLISKEMWVGNVLGILEWCGGSQSWNNVWRVVILKGGSEKREREKNSPLGWSITTKTPNQSNSGHPNPKITSSFLEGNKENLIKFMPNNDIIMMSFCCLHKRADFKLILVSKDEFWRKSWEQSWFL